MSHQNVLSLYKSLLRESQKFPTYNIREYALRRVRSGFRTPVSPDKHVELIKEGQDALALIKRQVVISSLFKTDPLVIENMEKK